MKHKSGNEYDVLGEIHVEYRRHFLCKLTPFYKNGTLLNYVVLPASEFEGGIVGEYVEVISNESVDTGKVPENDCSEAERFQAEE